MTYRNLVNANFANIATVDTNGNITGITVGNITSTTSNAITANATTINATTINTTGTQTVDTLIVSTNSTIAKSSIANVQLSLYEETVSNIGNVSGSLTFNLANGSTQNIVATGNITINNSSFTNMVKGSSLTVIITQGAGGSKLLTTSGIKYSNGGTNTLSTTAGAIDIINYFYDGAIYYGSLIRGYQ